MRQAAMLRQAHDPEATTESLDALSASSFMAVRRAVAEHPNASASALVRIFDAAPEKVLANPAWMLHLIADPGLFDQLSALARVEVANWHRCPATYVKWACRRGEEAVLWRLVMNRHLRPDLRAQATCHLSAEAVERLSTAHPSGDLPEALLWLWRLPTAAAEAAVEVEALRALIAWGPRGAEAVIRWAGTPAEVLATLARHPDGSIREAVAAHAHTDEATRAVLAADPMPAVRAAAEAGPPPEPSPDPSPASTEAPLEEAPDEAPRRRRSFGLLSR